MAEDNDGFANALAKIRKQLGDLRRLISGAESEKLNDLDSLLSVAQSEVDRQQDITASDEKHRSYQ